MSMLANQQNGKLLTADFNYTLHESQIAKKPVMRGTSRLLVYKDGLIVDYAFDQLADLLPNDASLVFNDSKVLPARLFFLSPGGLSIELLLLEPYKIELTRALDCSANCAWRCMVGGRRKWKEGVPLFLDNENTSIALQATWLDREDNVVQLSWQPDELTMGQVLEQVGNMPLPPYLNRAATKTDTVDYQTTYANAPGAVAAPTAGLHFTNGMLGRLREKGHEQITLTLHVGAGTFMPVKTEAMADHAMHAERYSLPLEVLAQLAASTSLIAVGTTSLRTLETLYWRGASLLNTGEDINDMPSLAWQEWVQSWTLPTYNEAFAVLHAKLLSMGLGCEGSSAIFILPGYPIQTVLGLITNFHQPNSTLLGLVASFVGDNWRHIYAHALTSGYRFLSYGDSSLLLPSKKV